MRIPTKEQAVALDRIRILAKQHPDIPEFADSVLDLAQQDPSAPPLSCIKGGPAVPERLRPLCRRDSVRVTTKDSMIEGIVDDVVDDILYVETREGKRWFIDTQIIALEKLNR